ncbi:MAG: DUF4437 domain-containing protein [Gemmatimonadota bacterium]
MRKTTFGFACLIALAACGPADDGAAEVPEVPADGTAEVSEVPAEVTSTANDPVPITAEELEWFDLDPEGAPGVEVAMLWGDLSGDEFGAFFKLPAGFPGALHTHTHPMKLVIVSGTYVQQPEGSDAFRLGPGSYLMQPGGDYRHTTSCDPAEDCVFFVESDGAFDLFPVEE